MEINRICPIISFMLYKNTLRLCNNSPSLRFSNFPSLRHSEQSCTARSYRYRNLWNCPPLYAGDGIGRKAVFGGFHCLRHDQLRQNLRAYWLQGRYGHSGADHAPAFRRRLSGVAGRTGALKDRERTKLLFLRAARPSETSYLRFCGGSTFNYRGFCCGRLSLLCRFCLQIVFVTSRRYIRIDFFVFFNIKGDFGSVTSTVNITLYICSKERYTLFA